MVLLRALDRKTLCLLRGSQLECCLGRIWVNIAVLSVLIK